MHIVDPDTKNYSLSTNEIIIYINVTYIVDPDIKNYSLLTNETGVTIGLPLAKCRPKKITLKRIK